MKEPRPEKSVFVPKKYAGQWIAWNQACTTIVGSGATLRDAQAAALAAGEPDPGLEWVPPSNRRLVGIRR